MNSLSPAKSVSAKPCRSFLQRLPRLTCSLVACWYDRYLERLALAELDERLLADIGVSPEEARHECAQRFWRPTLPRLDTGNFDPDRMITAQRKSR